MSVHLKLLVGLGNPTSKYDKTRHNAGFWFLDEVAARHGLAFRQEPRFHGVVARLDVGIHSIHLLKPTTYMNLSGQSVLALAHFYRILPGEILVAHDDMDFSAGTVRFKTGGGHGGHNGLRDIMGRLGTGEFHRLRFGIGHPGDRSAVLSYVLGVPPEEEASRLAQAIQSALGVLPELLAGKTGVAQSKLHTQPASPKKGLDAER